MANQKLSTIKPRATKKAKTRRSSAQEPEGFDRFGVLLEESEKFCEGVGLHKHLIAEILKTDSDWAFMLKVDALLESASKRILREGLRIKLLNRVIRNEVLDDFVDSLPMNGRTSLLKLLAAAGLPGEELGFVEVTRRVRNAYAHNIEYADLSLIELIKKRQDKPQLLMHLSAIKTYDEADLITSYEKDPSFLRFCIIDSAMRFLFYAYHLAVKKTGTKCPSSAP
jgi:hypothetical protein